MRFAATLAILLAIGATSYRSAIRLAENARRMGHTPKVVSTLSALYADFAYATCRRRGSALTGDEDEAERARTAAPSIRRRVAERRRLTADNGGQQARRDRRGPLVIERPTINEAPPGKVRRSP
jgi:CHASE3 domain sensor protein